MSVYVPDCMYVQHVCAVPTEARKKGVRTCKCELPCGYWDSDLSPLPEQQVFLPTELSD